MLQLGRDRIKKDEEEEEEEAFQREAERIKTRRANLNK